MNPTVSIRRIDKLQGNRHSWAVTSRVANKASFGSMLPSPVSRLISVVLPEFEMRIFRISDPKMKSYLKTKTSLASLGRKVLSERTPN